MRASTAATATTASCVGGRRDRADQPQSRPGAATTAAAQARRLRPTRRWPSRARRPRHPGDTLCKSGSTTGWTCGIVEAVDQSIPVSGKDVNTIVATTCLIPGDSGGGAVIGTDAAGIDSGSDFPSSATEASEDGTPGAYPCGNPNSEPTNPDDPGYQSVFFPMVSAGLRCAQRAEPAGHALAARSHRSVE